MGRFFGGTKAYSTVGNIEIVFFELGRTALTPFDTLMAGWTGGKTFHSGFFRVKPFIALPERRLWKWSPLGGFPQGLDSFGFNNFESLFRQFMLECLLRNAH